MDNGEYILGILVIIAIYILHWGCGMGIQYF